MSEQGLHGMLLKWEENGLIRYKPLPGSRTYWRDVFDLVKGTEAMQKHLTLINNEETNGKETNNVVDLITLPGGKGPTNTHPNDWLSPLPDGTIFLFYNKKNPNDPNLGQGKILNRTPRAIYLGFIVNSQPMTGPVDPLRFSNAYGLFENLGTILEQEEEETTEEEIANEQRDRIEGNGDGSTDGLAGDASLPGVPEGPRET